MIDSRDEGLGGSVAIYAVVMAVALALFVLPVLWANGAAEYDNPPLPKYDITSSRPLTDQHRQIPLARLKREDIVDQKALAAINHPAPKRERITREARERPSRSARTAYAQVPDHEERAPQRPRYSFFGLSLF